MSAPPVRRIKERGPTNPIITSLSSGKENPTRPGPTHKPTIRPGGAAAAGGSISRPKSRPRGRTPSPSDFTKRVHDLSKSKVLEKRVSEKGVFGIRVCSDLKESSHLSSKFRDSNVKTALYGRKEDVRDFSGGKFRDLGGKNGDKRSSGLYRKEGHLGVVSEKNGKLVENDVVGITKSCSELSLKGSGLGLGSGLEEGKVRLSGGKQASKLHEKLAFLEGKVKRIASDIKKTKEMLDINNNSDESRMILHDIQEKISGIEKAMGNVIVDPNSNGVAKKEGIDDTKQPDGLAVSVKGLSCDELEARLFPHHKLLRDRTSSKVSATHASESNTGLNYEKSINPVDEDPIALEFLASLNKMETKANATDEANVRIADEVQDTEDTETSTARQGCGGFTGKQNSELDLQADEMLDEFDDQEKKPATNIDEDIEDISMSQLIEIGRKTSTGGWFVSEGESILLAHDDGSCSFYDVANHEEKAEYKAPAGISPNIWRDCWIIRAPGADGCSGKYVVAASAGNMMDSGFCSWNFYSKDVQAFHTEDNKTIHQRVALGPLPDNNIMYRRNALGDIMSSENRQWWYRPCGPLLSSTATGQRAVKVFDIRDGELIMKWNVQKSVVSMDYSSPLQWRNRGKVVLAETEAISLWDVSSQNPQALSSVSTSGHRISALHVNNTDAELGGGVRQRVSSSEAEGNDGVFCTADSVNILDFRQPSGIGLKIPKISVTVDSVSSRGDSVFLGCSSVTSAAKKQVSVQVQQLSLRMQRVVNTYVLPESNAHLHHKASTQVWGNSNLVMAVCGQGLFVFDTLRDDVLPSFAIEHSSPQKVREVIGPDDLYAPSFDYISNQVLLISRDRPAMWRHLP